MFERFTQPARDVVVDARVQAEALRHPVIGTEHLLLALVNRSTPEARLLARFGVSADAVRAEIVRLSGPGKPSDDAALLAALGIDLDQVRSRIEETFGPGALDQAARAGGRRRGGPCSGPGTGSMRFSPRAKKVLELSLRESLALKQRSIGSEHILLGLLREGQGLAAQVLSRLGADTGRVRAAVIEAMGGTEGGAAAV